jgi:putative FmdB family regulatory protein
VPTYEYACTECGDQTEVVQKFTDDPLTVCGACGGRLRKVFSPVGIVFKGSGFYRTDSRAASKDLVGAQKANGEAGPKPSGDSKPGESPAAKTAANGSPAGGESGSGASTSPGSAATSGNGSSPSGKPTSAKVA